MNNVDVWGEKCARFFKDRIMAFPVVHYNIVFVLKLVTVKRYTYSWTNCEMRVPKLDVIIKVNNRKLINGILEQAGIKKKEEAIN